MTHSFTRPGQQLIDTERVDDAVGREAGFLGARTPVRLPVQLTRRMRVGVDAEHATRVDRLLQQSHRWVESFRSTVDLNRDAVRRTRSKDLLGIELRLRATTADHD